MTVAAYASYRDSGVEWLGEVPSHWQVRRLKHIADAFPSNVDKKSYDDGKHVRLCNYTDVYYNDVITDDPDFMLATATADQVAKFTLRAGDTIITKDSETADDIASAAYVPTDMPGVVCGYHLSMIRPRADVSGAFIKRYFDSAFAKSSVHVRANGLTRVGLGQYAIDNLDLPLPPPSEQTAIAAFLDRETGKIDALVEAQRRLIELLKEKRQAVISHAVTKGLDPTVQMKDSGVEWLGDVPAHWEVVQARRLIRSFEQGFSPECFAYPAEPGEWGVLKSGCVNHGVYREEENKALPPDVDPRPQWEVVEGDLLMSRASGSPDLIGSVALVRSTQGRILMSDKIFRLRLGTKMLSSFCYWMFASNALRAQIVNAISGGDGMANNLPQSSINEFWAALPPKGEQAEIASFLEFRTAKLAALCDTAEATTALLQERRAALISAAVTGKIDVRGLVPEQAEAA